MTHKGDSEAFGVASQCQVTGTSFLDEEPFAMESPTLPIMSVKSSVADSTPFSAQGA